jgi:hypothetical protein
MKFLIQESQKDQNFSLVYRDEDYSFDIEPLDGSGVSSIMINDLQLEIDDEGKIIYTSSTSKAPNRAELKAPAIELLVKGLY